MVIWRRQEEIKMNVDSLNISLCWWIKVIEKSETNHSNYKQEVGSCNSYSYLNFKKGKHNSYKYLFLNFIWSKQISKLPTFYTKEYNTCLFERHWESTINSRCHHLQCGPQGPEIHFDTWWEREHSTHVYCNLLCRLSSHVTLYSDCTMFVDLESTLVLGLSWKAFSNAFTMDLWIASLKFWLMNTYNKGFRQLLTKAMLEVIGVPT